MMGNNDLVTTCKTLRKTKQTQHLWKSWATGFNERDRLVAFQDQHQPETSGQGMSGNLLAIADDGKHKQTQEQQQQRQLSPRTQNRR